MSKRNEILLEAVKRGYMVNKNGDVISPHGNTLKPCLDHGYYVFNIRVDGVSKQVEVHRLVGYIKFGDSVLTREIRHLNNNSKDNSWSNIGIGTRKDNELDFPKEIRVRYAKNAASFVRKLTYDRYLELKKDRESGLSYGNLAEKYSLSKSTLWYIIHNENYGMPS